MTTPLPHQPVTTQLVDATALIVIDNPPVNALGLAVRRGIAAAVEGALANEAVLTIVIAAEGQTFPAGADISEFGKLLGAPSLPDLCYEIEASPKPVIAALHGTVLGGGLELAMAAHYRVAHETARLGLPEIKLGILPGAGGTQRTPRLVGVDVALDMMLSGLPVKATDATQLGLIDGIAQGATLREVALQLAAVTTETRPTRDERDALVDGAENLARIAARRAKASGSLASQKIIDLVEAACLVPFEVGLEMERDAFNECLASPVSAGLRHAFFAERNAMKFPERALAKPGRVDQVGIVGGGLMGSGIAIACLEAGYPVTMIEEGEAGVTQALERIDRLQKRRMGQGPDQLAAAALSDLNLTTDITTLSEVDLVIECATEDPQIKQQIFEALGSVTKPDAILASNTSYQDLHPLAQASGRPETVLAMHFFAPAERMALVEIGVLAASSAQSVATAHGFVRELGKRPVRATASPGLIGNRLLAAYRSAADRLLLRGANPAQIDEVMRAFGMPQGPYEAQDRSGLDIGAARRKHLSAAERNMFKLPDRLCAAGWLGRKSGRGYYVYDEAGKSIGLNGEMISLLEMEQDEKDLVSIPLKPSLMRDHMLFALINEGANLLGEGLVTRPSDIDAVMLHGFGYPRHRGGPMFDADLFTPFRIAQNIRNYAKEDPDFWQLSPHLAQLAAERQRFCDFNPD